MKKIFVLVIVEVMAFVVPSYAQQNFSIPVDNWTYSVIQQLQNRGYLLDLSPGLKPYTRMQVARALENFRSKVDVSKLPPASMWLVEKLDREFSYELRLLRAEKQTPDTSIVNARFAEEAFLNLAKGDYKTLKQANKTEFRPTLRTEFGFDIGNHLSFYTDATVDQTLRDDTLYTGSTKFGLDVLAQQAYIRYSSKYVDLTFGRDYLSWGYGYDGEPFISTIPGGLDMLSLFVKTHLVKFNWFVAQLDPLPEFTPDTNNYLPFGPGPTSGQPDPTANRYLTGSRIEFNLDNKVFLAAYQAALFGGPNASINFLNTNPVRVNYETTINNHLGVQTTNNFLGADVSVFWPKDFNLYGGLLIDDWQVDHKVKGDLKPNLYAIQTGIRASDLLQSLGVTGTDASLQYMMAGNRVYNQYSWVSFQKLLLRNYPVANPFGDDYWNIDLRLSQWLSYDWKIGFEIMHLEHGSSNIYGLYTMPWFINPAITDSMVAAGYRYKEPFPFGVIQETNMFEANILYQPASNFYGQAMISYSQNRNYGFVSGVNKGIFSFLFTIYYNFTANLPFN